MSTVLPVIAPIFALIALGYGVRRTGAFGPADLRALGRYVVMLALPALIFRGITAGDIGTLIDPAYLAAYLLGSLATFAAGYGLSRRTGGGRAASTFQATGTACANSGFFGYPILLLAMPAVAERSLALNMIVENLVLIPLVLVLAEGASGAQGVGRTLGRVVTNPIVIALLAGLTVAMLGLPIPQALVQAVDLIARSSAAVSLVVIGGTLVDVPRSGLGGRVAAVATGKLVLHPLAVAGCFALLSSAGVAVDPVMASAGVLMAAMPVMGVYPILAAQYGQGASAAMVMLATTLGGFFTVGGVLLLLRVGGG
jgi:malonate transporter and related proteins